MKKYSIQWIKSEVKDYPMICAWCGNEIGRSSVEHSHGICEECSNREINKYKEKIKKDTKQ